MNWKDSCVLNDICLVIKWKRYKLPGNNAGASLQLVPTNNLLCYQIQSYMLILCITFVFDPDIMQFGKNFVGRHFLVL